MARHEPLSPSSSHRWMICTASPNAIAKALELKLIKHSKGSANAAQGSVAHDLIEQVLDFQLSEEELIAMEGETVVYDGYSVEVDLEMINHILDYTRYILGQIESIAHNQFDHEIIIEKWSSLKSLGVEGMEGGTPDVVIITYEVDLDERKHVLDIYVSDFKYGFSVVEHTGNTQIRMYAAGIVLSALEGYIIHPDDKPTITLEIAQPRASHPEGKYRHDTITFEELAEWVEVDLVPAGKACNEGGEFVPGEKQCQWCPLSGGHCQAEHELAQGLAVLDFEEFDEPTMLPAAALSMEQRKYIIKHGEAVKGYIDKVIANANEEFLAGNGYDDVLKAVRGRTNRRFKEECKDTFDSPLLEHLKPGQIFKEVMRGLGEIETALRAKVGPKKANELMQEYAYKPTGPIKVVPVTAKGEAVFLSAKDDFAEFESEDDDEV